ncbi:MAG: DUF58 domain-containing protein [Candidatus Thiodiazotropha sp.]
MRPGPRLVHSLALLGLPALAAPWVPALGLVWKGGLAVLVMLALIDLLRLRRLPTPGVVREIHTTIPVGVWSEVRLILDHRGDRPLNLSVHDHHPADCQVEGLPQSMTLAAQRRFSMGYRLRPKSRGEQRFPLVDLVLKSPLGLWRQKRRIDHLTRVRVFPNFREIAHYALLATDNHLSQIGVRKRQRRGEGSDFHQLREYRTGDSLRQIDWKASSRYRKLISKEYQDERDQQLVFLLDCGRHMRHEDADGAHLDHALNAMLLLSYVAARQGDAVGFLSFGGVDRWQPPIKGGNLVRRMLDRSYDIETTLEAADYLGAAQKLMPLQRRRALIVIITNSRTEEQHNLQTAVKLLARRHLVVVADLHEASLDKMLSLPVTNRKDALRFQSVLDYLETRKAGHERIQYRGARVIDSRPQQLPINLVNAYLDVKTAGRL